MTCLDYCEGNEEHLEAKWVKLSTVAHDLAQFDSSNATEVAELDPDDLMSLNDTKFVRTFLSSFLCCDVRVKNSGVGFAGEVAIQIPRHFLREQDRPGHCQFQQGCVRAAFHRRCPYLLRVSNPPYQTPQQFIHFL